MAASSRTFASIQQPDDPPEGEKVRRIAELRAAGFEPRIDLLCYGLSDVEASLVEAVAIDLIGRPPLTNIMAGNHGHGFGRMTSHEVITMLTAKPVAVREPALLITINQLYRSGMSPLELYEATRGFWVIGPRREKVELALAVYQGVVREVYRIKAWHPAGTMTYETRDARPYLRRGADGSSRARSRTMCGRSTSTAPSARVGRTRSGTSTSRRPPTQSQATGSTSPLRRPLGSRSCLGCRSGPR